MLGPGTFLGERLDVGEDSLFPRAEEGKSALYLKIQEIGALTLVCSEYAGGVLVLCNLPVKWAGKGAEFSLVQPASLPPSPRFSSYVE